MTPVSTLGIEIASASPAGQARRAAAFFLVLASWLLGSAKFACLQRQKPAMFAQMPLFVYRHFNGSVCTASSNGRSVALRIFSSRYNAVRIAHMLAYKRLLFLLSWSPAIGSGRARV
jgi:hypothetical protein